MNAYTVSRLADDAGVSVHVVRDYIVRGLLRPVARTAGGYGLFDAEVLQRLCFVRAALDASDGDETAARLADLCQLVEHRRQALAHLEAQLTTLTHETSEIWP